MKENNNNMEHIENAFCVMLHTSLHNQHTSNVKVKQQTFFRLSLESEGNDCKSQKERKHGEYDVFII